MKKSGPEINEDLVIALEKQLDDSIPEEFRHLVGEKIKLPTDYREFLLEHNGGDPEKSRFNVKELEYPSLWITEFFFLEEHLAVPNYEDTPPLSLAFQYYVFEPIIPSNCLPIAGVVRDDCLLLNFAGKSKGKIYLKYMQEILQPDEAPEDYDVRGAGMYHLADSFSEFIEKLQLYADQE